MAEIDSLNVSDNANTARFPEGQLPSTVNNGARALEGMLARGFKDGLESTLTSTGSANAYELTSNRTITAYYQGLRLAFIANFANDGAATIDVDSVGDVAIFKQTADGPAALTGGEIQEGQLVELMYDGTQFQLISNLYSLDIDGLPEENVPAADDTVAVYDASASANRKVALSDFIKVIPFPTVKVFTSSGTWTKPEGLRGVKVIVTGAGGGGGGSGTAQNNCSGGGGGAGGTSIKWIAAADLGATEDITVGSAGAAGAASGDGGDGGGSDFGSHCWAEGGSGGRTSAAGVAAAPGTGHLGDINLSGGYGSAPNGTGNISVSFGSGGASYWGGGGSGQGQSNGSVGTAGAAPGSGGGPGFQQANAGARAGGAGAPGIVVVEEFY